MHETTIDALLARLHQHIAEGIKTKGRGIMIVGNSRDVMSGRWPFAYTVGNHLKGVPELLAIGSNTREFGNVLNYASDRLLAVGGFESGSLVSIGGEFPVMLINAHPMVKDKYTIQATQYLGTDAYRVQQVLAPDTFGRYPGDPACNFPYGAIPVHRVQ